jgi:hypothetical protein
MSNIELTEQQCAAMDECMEADKRADGYGQREYERAMRLQLGMPANRPYIAPVADDTEGGEL